jgi:hydroxymethylpyrimidine/phosphomethylpyrimidine kinase
MGLPLHESIEQAKRLVTAAIAHGPDLGGGAAPVDPMAWIARTMP